MTSHILRSVLWKRNDTPALERCALHDAADAFRLEGTVLTLADGTPTEIHYHVACSNDWHTREAFIEMRQDDNVHTLNVVCSNGRWSFNGREMPELAGLVDIDLSFSPCTNTLPIRRFSLAPGDHADVTAVWIRIPHFEVETLTQRYTRTGPRNYRYESRGGQFTADLEVDELGLIVKYGPYWERVKP